MRLFDGHCDTPYELWMRGETLEQNSCHIDLQKTSEFGAFAQIFAFCSYAGTPMAHKRLLTEPLKLLKDHILKHSDRMGLADTAEQIRQLHAQGKAAALLSLEGAELIDCDPEQISELCQISYQAASFRAERMELLYARNKFLTSPLEQQVYLQFMDYIQRKKKRI